MSWEGNPLEHEYAMEDFADSLRQLRGELVERLEAREDRMNRDMVGLIEAMLRLDMPPPYALTAVVWIMTALDAPTTRNLLVAYATGLTGAMGEEIVQGAPDPETLQPVDEAAPGPRGRLN